MRSIPDRSIHQNAGFTVLELLVVISLLGVLVSLIVPAVQKARESSRRTKCLANLQGLGQALHNFESAHKRFPPLMGGARKIPVASGGTELASFTHHSPHVQLLPFLDQSNVHQKFDESRKLQYAGDVNATLPDYAATVISTFLCPSDIGDFGNNYRFCTGQSHVVVGDGAFADLRGRTAGRFRDGFSNTVAVSEAIKSDTNSSTFGPGDYWISALNAVRQDPTRDEVITTCNSLATSDLSVGRYFPYVGHTWAISGYDFTLYNHTVAPNAVGYECTTQARSEFLTETGSMSGIHKASSRHESGVNVLMMDGSSRFVADSVSVDVWRSLASIAAGDIANSSSY